MAEHPSVIHSTPRTYELLPAGYLGPTSFLAGFEESGDLISNAGEQSTEDGRESPAMAPSPWWIKRATEVLCCLNSFSTIKTLIQEYYSVSQIAVIASPLILNALNEIEITVNESLSETAADEQLFALSALIIQNTSKTFKIPHNVDGTTFHKCFTGPFLRLEIIGVICALAGRASYFGLADSMVRDTESRTHFSRKMLVACDLTLQICKGLTVLNDLALWLVHENLLLLKLVQGDSSRSPFSIPLESHPR